MKLKKLLNLPNAFSVLRVVMVPFFFSAVLKENLTQSLLILVLVIASDVADGRIARKFKLNSVSGGIIDATCDSIFMFSALVLFVSLEKFPIIAFVLLVFAAALKVGGLYLIIKITKKLKSSIWSKLSAGLIYLLLVLLLFDIPYLAIISYIVVAFNMIIGVKRKIDGLRILFHEIRTSTRRTKNL